MFGKKKPSPPYPQASKAVKALLRDVQGDDVSLDATRARIFEALRTLDLAPHLVELALRRMSEQTTKPGLVTVLRDFVTFLSSPEASTAFAPGSLHARVVDLEQRVQSTTTFLVVLIELLVEKGIVSHKEVGARMVTLRASSSDTS